MVMCMLLVAMHVASHNLCEVWYHVCSNFSYPPPHMYSICGTVCMQPSVYKTHMCPFILNEETCPWGSLCSHAHSDDERRSATNPVKCE